MYMLPFPGIQNVATWVRICCRVNGTLPRHLCGWSSLEGPNLLRVSSLALHVLMLRVPGNLQQAIWFYDVPLGNRLVCTTIVQHRQIPIVFVSRVVEDADPLLFEELGISVTRHR